jgi:peptidoglycan/LPS O-acetylase OafA/YrhL
MTAPAQTAPADLRWPELDGLRAIAILLVLVSHHLPPVSILAIQHLGDAGWIGVDLFFVLSGFLIGGILLEQRTSTNYYRVFYWRRFFRIVPLYALLLLPAVLVLGLGLQRWFAGSSLASLPAGGLWFCLFFLQNVGSVLGLSPPNYLGPTWSVAVEEQFYLLLPPVIRHVRGKTLLLLLLAAIVAAPVLRGTLLQVFGPPAGLACYVLLPCRWDSLLLGVVAALAFRQAGFHTWFSRHQRWIQIYAGFSAAVSVALLAGHPNRLHPVLAFGGYTLIDSCFVCVLLLALLNQSGGLKRFLRLPAFKPIATISYGLYLLQSPVQAVIDNLCRRFHLAYEPVGWPAVGVSAASLAATFLLAMASWKILERRFIQMGHQHRFQKF